MAPKERIEELREKLNEYNRLYYVENTPAVSDRQFDEMLRELQELEQRYPEYYDVNSPTQRVGSDMTNRFEAVRHRYPMMSLANTYSLEELREFYDRVTKETGDTEFACELKFDGTAISLTYEEGRLVRAVTRGDGTMGDDVTANVRTIRSIPLVLSGDDWPRYFEMRGEIY
ncbi:MAG: NAD-dependent DNA ligase LigA, partial [Tidjanibacter sp.]|nr:NAD-dependent DNA ligase LigA [Tidjanibacter sp.]